MKNVDKLKYYSPVEERINIVTHGIGLVLSIIGLILLITHAAMYRNELYVLSFSIFGISLVVVYAASTIYHSIKKPELRMRMKIVDHAAIYLLIAGTYTPLTLITLHNTLGWVLFIILWIFAITGISLKLFFTGRYSLLSTIMYVLMGWIIVIAIKSIFENLPLGGFVWFITGGLVYTVGAILYSIKKIKFNHAIFHFLVVIGSFCHFVTVNYYVLP